MAGFEDADDCDRLCRDGILKMCAGRSASDEIDLASQPTMTRLENRLSRRELFDIGEAFIDDFIASYHIFGAAKVTILFRFGIKFYKKFHILGILPIFAVACNKYITMLYES